MLLEHRARGVAGDTRVAGVAEERAMIKTAAASGSDHAGGSCVLCRAKVGRARSATRQAREIARASTRHVGCYADRVMSEGNRDEHLEVLRAMWGEMKTLNARVNTTNERLEHGFERLDGRIGAMGEVLGARIDATNERLDATNERLDRLTEGVTQARAERRRIDRLEERVDALERRDR